MVLKTLLICLILFPDTVNRSVVVNVVINQEFKDKYEDKNSPEYRDFVGNFTNQVNGKMDESCCFIAM